MPTAFSTSGTSIASLFAGLLAVISLCASWLAVLALCAGLGTSVRLIVARAQSRSGGPGERQAEGAARFDLWIGFAASIVLLQLWNLWLPIDRRTLWLLAIGATPGLAIRARDATRPRDVARDRGRRGILILAAAWALAAPWLALHVSGQTSHYDTGLYHLQSVTWASSFPIVPGLANLHDRFGFNSTFHLFAALCQALPGDIPASRVANPALFLAALGLLVGLATDNAIPRALRVFSLLAIGPLVAQVPRSYFYGLAAEFAVFAMQSIIMTLLFLVWGRRVATASPRYPMFVLPALCAVAITLKLSAAGFAVASVAACIACAFHQVRSGERPATTGPLRLGLAVAGLTIALWMVRGIILSGYPMYPVAALSAPVEWRVPPALVIDMNHWIQSWARTPQSHWANVLGNNSWVAPWMQRNGGELTLPVLIATTGLLLGVSALLRDRRMPSVRLLAILAPPVIALPVWFFTAPDIRFAAGPIWLAATAILALGWTAVTRHRRSSALHTIEWAFAAALVIAIGGMPRIQAPGIPPYPAPEIHPQLAADGTVIGYPAPGGHCWDTAIPCTPYKRPSLVLRRTGDLGSGFRLADTLDCINLHSCRPKHGLRAPVDLGVDLPWGDWLGWEPARNVQWMLPTAHIVLYTGASRSITLRLHVAAIVGTRDYLRIAVGDGVSSSVRIPLVSGETLETDLDLRAGFNVITLEATGSADHQPTSRAEIGDARVAYSMIEIIDRALGEPEHRTMRHGGRTLAHEHG